ncbi:hypothetical protein FOXB_14303 [Fusarium oxysporum f. sp. conglutinans Fo5176]|uniref:Zn(2)-C6 fungal-type domain-containing protein n=2 Tax=Fusarium oxysporum f. sp. conglutinans TaxID=100902 RepID=F9G6M1_FUSOF|nr:hypothetical protein FOXB_14303 [Fusarium oxysporum f. sp. conglutinans Fo5176]
MVTTRSQDLPRKKRTRAKGSKVRTGCITCKSVLPCRRRHLKCDEAKPSCFRCRKDQWACDGYLQPSSKSLSESSNGWFISPLHPNPHQRTCLPITSIPPALTDGIIVNSTDNALYYHVRKRVIPDLEMTNGSGGFWYKIILPLSNSNKPIKHTLCALGASHQHFLASHPGKLISFDHSINYDYQADLKYGEAIALIREVMADNSTYNTRIALICCTILICIENLHRRYTNSVRHLCAGYQLLESLRIARSWDRTSSGNIHRQDQNDGGLLDTLAAMFSSLGESIGAFTGDTSFSNVTENAPVLEIGYPQTPFATIAEREDCLSALNVVFDNGSFGRDTRSECVGQVSVSPAHRDEETLAQALKPSQPLLYTWSSRLHLFNTSARMAAYAPEDKRRLALLSLYQTTWSASLKMDCNDPRFEKIDYESILDKVEEAIYVENSQSRPLFVFDGHIVRELSTICASCTRREIRKRSITLLRSMHRREGVWDSWEVANV